MYFMVTTRGLAVFVISLLYCISDGNGMGDPPDIVIRPELFWKHRLRHSARKLRSHMHLSCLEESTVVSFRRQVMTTFGILPNQMTLDQGSCQFESNRTHYFVNILYKSRLCSSLMTEERNKMFIKNLVRIIPPHLLKVIQDTQDDEDELVVIGSGDFSAEDNSNIGLIDIPFHCEYSSDATILPPTLQPLADESYSIASTTEHIIMGELPTRAVFLPPNNDFTFNMYERHTLMRKFQPVMNAVPTQTLLFAQIRPKPTGVFEKAFLHNCYYHNKLGEKVIHNQNIYLIKNGCPIDETVMIMQGYNNDERLFKFQLRKIFSGFTNIRCELRPCSMMGTQRDKPSCVSQMTYCSSKPEITSPHTQLLSVDWPHTLIVTNNPNKNEVDQISDLGYRPTAANNCTEERTATQLQQCTCKSSKQSSKKDTVTIWVALVTALLSFILGAGLVGVIWWMSTSITKPQPPPNITSASRMKKATYTVESSTSTSKQTCSTYTAESSTSDSNQACSADVTCPLRKG